MSEAKTASFNAWISENAIRLMRSLNTSAPLNEDAFQYSATFIIAATPTKMPDGTTWYRVLTYNPVRTN